MKRKMENAVSIIHQPRGSNPGLLQFRRITMRLIKALITAVVPVLCVLSCAPNTTDPGSKTGTLVFDYGLANSMAKIIVL
jgi:hypothetical protein